MIDRLLAANPEAAATYRDWDGVIMLHMTQCIGDLPSELCIDVMKLVLARHKDAVQETDTHNKLPAHYATEMCDIGVDGVLVGLVPCSSECVDIRWS